MKFVRSVALAAFAITVFTTPARADDAPTKSVTTYRGNGIEGFYRAATLDLNLEGGGGYFWGKQSTAIGFGRVRTGLMIASWPVAMSLGVTFEINNVSLATYGLQYEFTHVASGGWFQLGALVDARGNFGGTAAVGWSIIGIEAQVRGYDEVRPAFQGDYGFALFAKLRIPLGYIFYALRRR